MFLRKYSSRMDDAINLALYFFYKEVVMQVYVVQQKSYGFFKFLGDCIMVFLTWGLWLIWIFVREMRRRSNPYC